MKKIVHMFNICVAILLMSCNPINNPSANKHVFSVSADKQVLFSPGNLQYVISKDKWQFADNQWEYLGTANLNNPTYDKFNEGWVSNPLSMGDVIDMFPWGKADNPTIKSANIGECGYIEYINYIDYGTNVIDKYPANTWRTLTYEEWQYLFCGRPNANYLYAMAQVCDVNGVIVLPDDWECPNNLFFLPGNSYGDYAEYQTFDKKQWHALERTGAIFLPAAGFWRNGIKSSEIVACIIENLQSHGYYWANSTAFPEDYGAYVLLFAADEVYEVGYENRPNRCSVRLVKDVK